MVYSPLYFTFMHRYFNENCRVMLVASCQRQRQSFCI